MIMRIRFRIGISIVFFTFSLLVMLLSQPNTVQSATTTPTLSIGSAAAPKSLSKIIVLTDFGPISGPQKGKIILSIVDADTGISTDVVELPNTASTLALSPDGKLIAYSANTEAGRTLFLMSMDGTGQHPVKADQTFGTNIDPSWSPDGRKLVYSSGKSLFSINIDGREDTPIVDSPTGEPLLESAWSPDGKHIVFQVGSIRGHLYIVDLDNTKASQFTDISTAAGSHPTWSPDGSKILFSSTRDDYSTVVYLANADGSNVHAILTNAYQQQGSSVWSPDGTKIALSTRAGIVVMNADGTSPHLLLSWQQRFRTSIDWGLIPSDALENVTPLPTLEPTQGSQSPRTPTTTLTPTVSLDGAAFDMLGAVAYTDPDHAIDILLPKSWKSALMDRFQYLFYYGTSNNPPLVLQVLIGSPQELGRLLGSDAQFVTTTSDLVAALQKSYQARATGSKVSKIAPIKIGQLDGVGFTVRLPAVGQFVDTDGEVRVASLPGGKVIVTFARASTTNWVKAKPVIDKMIDSLTVRSNVIPTTTLTPTPLSLELTATVLHKELATVEVLIRTQVWALTPTSTKVPGR